MQRSCHTNGPPTYSAASKKGSLLASPILTVPTLSCVCMTQSETHSGSGSHLVRLSGSDLGVKRPMYTTAGEIVLYVAMLYHCYLWLQHQAKQKLAPSTVAEVPGYVETGKLAENPAHVNQCK